MHQEFLWWIYLTSRKETGDHFAGRLSKFQAKVAHNGQTQANQRKRPWHCNAGENAFSISGKLQTGDSIESFNPVKHAMALSN